MDILFWFCAIVEFALALWWLLTDMRQTTVPMNPFISLAFLYLAVVLIVRYGLGWIRVSESMVMIPAVPLAGLGLIIVLYMTHKGRWN